MKSIFSISIFTVIFFLPYALRAQGQPSGFDDDVNDVPIDGGLSLLVAAGIGIGAKKLRDKRNTANFLDNK